MLRRCERDAADGGAGEVIGEGGDRDQHLAAGAALVLLDEARIENHGVPRFEDGGEAD